MVLILSGKAAETSADAERRGLRKNDLFARESSITPASTTDAFAGEARHKDDSAPKIIQRILNSPSRCAPFHVPATVESVTPDER
jgi:hypothetical protein